MTKKIFNFQFSIFNSPKGFTLVEMLIAVGIFTVITSFSLGAVLGIFNANKRAQAEKTIMDNLNFSIDNMARIVRFGSNYHCGSGGTLSLPQDCANNSLGVGDTFLAVTFYDKVLGRNVIVSYRLNGTAVEESYDGGSYKAITAPEAKIQYLRFYVFGTSNSDAVQPYVVAVMNGYVGNKSTNQSVFTIETLMSQRTLDLW